MSSKKRRKIIANYLFRTISVLNILSSIKITALIAFLTVVSIAGIVRQPTCITDEVRQQKAAIYIGSRTYQSNQDQSLSILDESSKTIVDDSPPALQVPAGNIFPSIVIVIKSSTSNGLPAKKTSNRTKSIGVEQQEKGIKFVSLDFLKIENEKQDFDKLLDDLHANFVFNEFMRLQFCQQAIKTFEFYDLQYTADLKLLEPLSDCYLKSSGGTRRAIETLLLARKRGGQADDIDEKTKKICLKLKKAELLNLFADSNDFDELEEILAILRKK